MSSAYAKDLASGTLYESISASTTTILVYVGEGSAASITGVWPDVPFYASIMPSNPSAGVPNSLDSEIIKVTAVGYDQLGNTSLTAVRAQRGTTSKAFTAGAIVTNASYAEDAVLLGDEETGTNRKNLKDANGNPIIPVVPEEGTYSTTEQEVGTWIDGKTIYRKTIDTGALPNSSSKSVSMNISHLGDIIKMEGCALASLEGIVIPLPSVGLSGYYGDVGLMRVSDKILVATTSNFYEFTESYVTLYYTKD